MRNMILANENTNKIEKVFCNQCGKELTVENGIIKEGCFCADILWGYFSQKDGIRHQFDLCEECYNQMISSFHIPVATSEETELV